MQPADSELLDHLAAEFGVHGRRAVEFLHTAEAYLSLSGSDRITRLPETAAYCLRETMKTILNSAQVEQAGQWRTVSRKVTEERTRYLLVRDKPGEDEQGALRSLLDSIDELDQIHQQDSIHQQRLIAIMVDRTGAFPLDVGTEPIIKYQKLLERLDKALHNQVSLDEARVLWDDSILALNQLFQPPNLRQQKISSIAAHKVPSQKEVKELLELLAATNHLQYFLSRVADPNWLDLLTDSGILDPQPTCTHWPVNSAIEKLAKDHSINVTAWLQGMYDRHGSDPIKARHIARAAVNAGTAALPIVLNALNDHGASPDLAHIGVWAAERAEPDNEIIEKLAELLLNSQAWNNAVHIEPVLEQLLAGLNNINAHNRIQLLCWKVRAISRADGDRFWYKHESAGSISKWSNDPNDRIGSLLDTLLSALERARDMLNIEAILPIIDELPGDLRYRTRAWILSNYPTALPAAIIEEISQAITFREPNGDDLALIDRAVAEADSSEYVVRWSESLGVPPSRAEIVQALDNHEVPPSVIRAFHWAGILPQETQINWHPTITFLADAFGPPPGRQALEIQPHVEMGWGQSPFTKEELVVLEPLEAVSKIAKWRPDPSQFLVNARDLARTLEEVVKSDTERWLAEPLSIARGLIHPTYIDHYLRATAEAVRNKALPAIDQVIDVITLVRSHPWHAVELGKDDFHFDATWDQAEQAGLAVLEALAERNLGFAGRDDEVWTILEEMVLDRSKSSNILSGTEDSLDHALNRSCTKALTAVLFFMDHEFRTVGCVRPACLALLTEVLRIEGDNGEQYRAILATRLGFLQHVAQDWFINTDSLLFGQEAPVGLAQPTADLAIKWGRPNRWFLEHHRDMLRSAVIREVDNSISHLVIAMLRDIPGYSGIDNTSFLKQTPKHLSKAGETLGRFLKDQDADTAHIERASHFWELAIDSGAKDGLIGFGWMAEIENLDDNVWADLTLKTLNRTGGKIDWGKKVARRASSIDLSTTTLSIMNKLVRGLADEWDSRGVTEQAVKVLKAATQFDATPEYEQLRTTLLEREALNEEDS